MSVISKVAAGGGLETVGFYCNTPIYRTIPDNFTRMPVQLPLETLRLIHQHMEYSNGFYSSTSGSSKPKSFAVPWFIEVPQPRDCIFSQVPGGRSVLKKNLTDSDRSGVMTRPWYDPEPLPDYVDQQYLADWWNRSMAHPLVGPARRPGVEALGEVELPSGQKIYTSDVKPLVERQIIEHVKALRTSEFSPFHTVYKPATFLTDQDLKQYKPWDLDYEHDEVLFYQTIHLAQMDVFGMGIIRQDPTNETCLNWMHINAEIANAGRAYIFERCLWSNKSLDDYRGSDPMQQVFNTLVTGAQVVEEIRPVPGQFDQGVNELEKERNDFLNTLEHFTYTPSNCEGWRNRELFLPPNLTSPLWMIAQWHIGATPHPLLACEYYIERIFPILEGKPVPWAPNRSYLDDGAPASWRSNPIEIQERQHALHMHIDDLDIITMRDSLARYNLTERPLLIPTVVKKGVNIMTWQLEQLEKVFTQRGIHDGSHDEAWPDSEDEVEVEVEEEVVAFTPGASVVP